MYIDNNKHVKITEPKTIHFDLSEKFDNSLKYEINYIIKYNPLSAEHTIKKLVNYLINNNQLIIVQIRTWKRYS